MRKREYEKLTYAVCCLMNGEPGSADHDPTYGWWETGMDTLDDLRRQYIKERKITVANKHKALRDKAK